MTKERKISLEMWKSIKEKFISYHNEGLMYKFDLYELKYDFLKKYDLLWWSCKCWFCTYMSCESKPCPLIGDIFNECKWYYIINNNNLKYSYEEQLHAFDVIINAHYAKGEKIENKGNV